MSENEILLEIGSQIEKLRLENRIKESDIERLSGVSRKTYYNFKNGKSGLSLRNFIRILKAINELDRLQRLFPETDSYSPAHPQKSDLPRRVRDNEASKRDFLWGDEE
ncbi:MAG: helix-turn-helix transcriptional regulator [Spirochaetales bacterium]|nr:helix-turn-helix transcriptional regulator [Spirochaetales bacterium]